MKYLTIRILAAILLMGSIGAGFFAGAEYGKLVGWPIFIVLAASGIFLHSQADKFKKGMKS